MMLTLTIPCILLLTQQQIVSGFAPLPFGGGVVGRSYSLYAEIRGPTDKSDVLRYVGLTLCVFTDKTKSRLHRFENEIL